MGRHPWTGREGPRTELVHSVHSPAHYPGNCTINHWGSRNCPEVRTLTLTLTLTLTWGRGTASRVSFGGEWGLPNPRIWKVITGGDLKYMKGFVGDPR